MRTSSEYLHAAKLEEVAGQLVAEGFEVTLDPGGPNRGYDLVASRGDEKLAVEVKDRRRLRDSAKEIRRLRDRARKHGYQFRLVVASPPHQVDVDVEGVAPELLRHLREQLPPELQDLSSRTNVERITEVVYDAVRISPTEIRVAGDGVVEVQLGSDAGQQSVGPSIDADFPMTFDLTLDHTLQIKHVNRLVIDTSSFSE